MGSHVLRAYDTAIDGSGILLMLDEVAQADLTADMNSAASCANSNCDGVPHIAITAFEPSVTILGPQRRNRRWDPREKARITAESFEPGATIAAVARRQGVSRGLLHNWRRTVRDRTPVEPISFVPLELEDSATGAKCELEIAIGDARIFVRDTVDKDMLRAVCEALRT
jgi:transposase